MGDRLSESTVETLVHDAWEIQNDLRLALLGSPDDQLRCQRWVQRGCRIYLSPTVTGERLLRSLTLAEDGFFILDEKFQRNTGVLRPVRESLTARETDVLELLSCGLTNSLIAQELFLSRSTVEFHIKRIFGKLGVSNRTEAAVRARELELGPERPYAAGLTP
ncbi:response regulator transcription factor [Crossiella cryophila]|uniref:DNA-binding NarL/FixJ family response regulator n=1 Tax=Crossiella cryophila TaxID=43355 RepID=A0A7W7FWM3_9PSEU|nr:response regulator transcription factor [Crossiella cryophila]MBB4680437.1 DNA-binding NarL/FixJ family response regulator [Crossiella cryophila]